MNKYDWKEAFVVVFFVVAITWCAFILGGYIQCGVDENFAVRIEKMSLNILLICHCFWLMLL